MKEKKFLNETGGIYFGWWVTLAGFILVVFGYSCIISITGVFLLPVTQELGFTIGEFSIYITILCLSSMVALFIFSKHMIKKHIRGIMIFGAICGGISFLGFGLSSALWQFYVLAIPMGFSFSLLTSTPCTLIVSNWFGIRLRGVALGVLFSPLGAMVMSWVMNIVVQNFGWRIGYFVIAACILGVCIPCVLIFMRWCPEDYGMARKGDGGNVDAASVEANLGATFKRAIKRPSTWVTLLSATAITIASGTVLNHTMAFLEMGGFSNKAASSVFSLMFGALVIGQIAVGAYCDKFKLKGGAIGTAIIFAIAFFAIIGIPHYPWLVIVLILGYGFGCPAVNVISPLLMNFMFGEKESGKFISYLNIFIAVGVACGSTIVGLIYDMTGSYTPAFILMGCLLLAAGVIRMIFASERYYYKEKISKEELEETGR